MNTRMIKSLKATVLTSSIVLLSACATTNPTSSGNESSDPYTSDVFQVSELAEAAYEESRWTDAARYYQKLTETVPNDAYIWFRLANTYVQKGDFNQAIHAYETSIARDSLQPKPWFNLSTTYLLNAKSAMLQSWEKLRPDDPARDIIMVRVQAIDEMMNLEMGKLQVRR